MRHGMRASEQLGADENGNEKEVAQRIHSKSLIDLNKQAFEVFAFRKVQRHGMVGGAGEAAHDAGFALGIDCRTGDDLLEQLQANAA